MQLDFTTMYLYTHANDKTLELNIFLPATVIVGGATKKVEYFVTYLTSFSQLGNQPRPNCSMAVFGQTDLFVRLHNRPKTMTN